MIYKKNTYFIKKKEYIQIGITPTEESIFKQLGVPTLHFKLDIPKVENLLFQTIKIKKYV
jgi:hypothetical protein